MKSSMIGKRLHTSTSAALTSQLNSNILKVKHRLTRDLVFAKSRCLTRPKLWNIFKQVSRKPKKANFKLFKEKSQEI